MSAYIVSRAHIRYLVSAAQSYTLFQHHGHLSWVWDIDRNAGTYKRAEIHRGDSDRANAVGKMLWDENIRSVRYRYPNTENLPGPIGESYEYVHDWTYDGEQYVRVLHLLRIDPLAVLKACDCLDYQSCEHPGWDGSEANAFLEALRKAAYRAIPGYENAAWHIADDDKAAT